MLSVICYVADREKSEKINSASCWVLSAVLDIKTALYFTGLCSGNADQHENRHIMDN